MGVTRCEAPRKNGGTCQAPARYFREEITRPFGDSKNPALLAPLAVCTAHRRRDVAGVTRYRFIYMGDQPRRNAAERRTRCVVELFPKRNAAHKLHEGAGDEVQNGPPPARALFDYLARARAVRKVT